MRGMFADRALGGSRPGESVTVQSFVFLDGGVETEYALAVVPHHNADQLVGDFNRISFRHDSRLASKLAPGILIFIFDLRPGNGWASTAAHDSWHCDRKRHRGSDGVHAGSPIGAETTKVRGTLAFGFAAQSASYEITAADTSDVQLR
jgi:hypothetical protein